MIFGKTRRAAERKGFLTRLVRDVRGNTLAIVAAAMIPLTAMIGSGIDMSRAYMAKTRLQSACDAAALAGRRVMEDDTIDANVTNTATQFLNFNFPQGLYQTAAFTPDITKPESGTVHIAVSTRMPTTIMRMFGFTTLPLDVTCDASLNFVNTDIMLVLDVTSSMLCAPSDGATNCHMYSIGDSRTRMVALQDAVMALYDQLKPIQDQLESNHLRLRYGIVPYSSTVNIGHLIVNSEADGGIGHPEYIADSASYQTRIANYTNPNYSQTNSPEQTLADETSTQSRQSRCDSWANQTNTTGTPPAQTTTDTYTEAGYNSHTQVCTRHHQRHTTTYTLQNYGFQNNSQGSSVYDTSEFKLFHDVDIGNNTNGHVPTSQNFNLQQLASVSGVSTASTTWNGCIEERNTVPTITSSSGFNIPDAAYDLNVNLVPNSAETRWRPMWPEVEYRTASSKATAYCPTAAARLQSWSESDMQSYIDSLVPNGYTYHDIGMIWGARLISNGGIFADSPDTYNGMPVSRHIIFMTDGYMQPDETIYSAYGVESMDHRIGATDANNDKSRHTQRLRMICNEAKSLNASIWVIGFSAAVSTLPDELVECASSPSQASTVADRDALIARFRQIGSQIGALRLTQ